MTDIDKMTNEELLAEVERLDGSVLKGPWAIRVDGPDEYPMPRIVAERQGFAFYIAEIISQQDDAPKNAALIAFYRSAAPELAKRLRTARREALEEAARWHDNQAALADRTLKSIHEPAGVFAYKLAERPDPEFWSRARRVHENCAEAIRALTSTAPQQPELGGWRLRREGGLADRRSEDGPSKGQEK